MSLLHCSHCRQPISATHKACPHCGRNVSLFSDLKSQVENNRLWQVALVILALLLLGGAWFWRMDGGSRWVLYIVLVLVAPLVPWLLKLAYKNAAPVEGGVECGEEKDGEDKSQQGATQSGASHGDAAQRDEVSPKIRISSTPWASPRHDDQQGGQA